MPPIPKRAPARRNRSAGAATLKRPDRRKKIPELPDDAAPLREWHPLTSAWWRDLWASPMAPEYDPSDVHGLYLLASLVDSYWREPSKEIAAEIRLQRQCFGLSPIDRRRLQWEIERGDEAQARGTRRRTATPRAAAPAKAAADPRAALYIV